MSIYAGEMADAKRLASLKRRGLVRCHGWYACEKHRTRHVCFRPNGHLGRHQFWWGAPWCFFIPM